MKKPYFIFVALLLFMQIQPALASAHTFSVERVYGTGNASPLVYDENHQPPRYNEVNGVKYIWDTLKKGCHPLEYSEAGYQALKEAGVDDCIWAGGVYMARNSSGDTLSSRYKGFNRSPIKFFDAEFNFLREYQFGGYPEKFGYKDGTYYCYVFDNNRETGGYLMTSTDTVNWTRVEGKKNLIPQTVGDVTFAPVMSASGEISGRLSINGSNFLPVAYENGQKASFGDIWAKWMYNYTRTQVSFSNDNIYFLDADIPVNTEWNATTSQYSKIYVYEYGDDIVIDANAQNRFRIPKQEVYAELAAIKDAPYVCVNNTILGFEQPPVTESDRTLVPMRFLFEKLGADVTWDEATETATARNASTAINFSIDNTTATVNGAAATMDVPARLVGDKTMVPLRFLSEELGYTVEWDEATRMATIVTEDSWENTLALSAPTPKRVQEM